MTVSKSSLVARWKNKLPSAADATIQDETLDALAEGIIDEIKAATITLNPAGLVDAEARPITGTATSTLS